MLERAGAQVVVFPRLTVQEYDRTTPSETLERWSTFDWVVVSGAPSARRLLQYVHPDAAQAGTRIATVGAGATAELKKAGLRPDCVPRRHTAGEVAEALDLQRGHRVLLVREREAAVSLPERIRALGASTTEVEGYRMDVQPDAGLLCELTHRLDFVAFANPTAVRILMRGLRELALDWRPDASVGIAVAGPATAAAAEDAGLKPTLVAEGSLRALLGRLIDHYGA